MTPKEKANDLLSKMWMSSSTIEDAKECALIAVDEILEAINIESVDDEPYSAMKIINIDEYWQEVKNEINNL